MWKTNVKKGGWGVTKTNNDDQGRGKKSAILSESTVGMTQQMRRI